MALTASLVVASLLLPLGARAGSTATPAGNTPAASSATSWPEFQKKVQPFFAENCYDCHGGDTAEAGIRLDIFKDQASLDTNADTLSKALLMLSSHKMPPGKQPQPPEAERATMVAWLSNYDESSVYLGAPKPGRVTIHRLNRAEYSNTIRDLLGTDFRPGDAFPADDAGYGFDNNGDVLSIAPVLMEKYLAAATQSLDLVVNVDPVKGVPLLQSFDVLALDGSIPKTAPAAPRANAAPPAGPALAVAAPGAAGAAAAANRGNRGGGRAQAFGRVFAYSGEVHGDAVFAQDGDYVIHFKGYNVQPVAATAAPAAAPANAAAVGNAAAPAAAGQRRGGGAGQNLLPQVTVQIDSMPASRPMQIKESFNNATIYQTPSMHIAAGRHRVTIAFLNGASEVEYKNAPPPPPPVVGGRRGGGGGGFGGPPGSTTGKPVFGMLDLAIDGPTAITPDRMPANYNKIFVAQPSTTVTKTQAAEKVLRHFANRAFRRPATDEEMSSLMAFWTKLDADQHTFNESIDLTLQAVLVSPQFLFRIEADPIPQEGGIHTLTEYELATRLSYFLWSSMPDDELFSLATQGKLRANLSTQVRRMLQDPKAQGLVDNFTGQWLQLRLLDTVSPLPDKFPAFDESLRNAMIGETKHFFQAVVQEDRSVVDFISANYTFVNERLAKHYGIPGITGEDFRRITIPAGQPRGGILTQASILTLTSYANRTSPVLRGKWVLENLFNAAPPPPPPGVKLLSEDAKAQLAGTMRQRMEQHRTDPTCAGCHARMDVIGFALENFDGIGAWRDKDLSGDKIDASGKLPDGHTFVGADGLRQLLVSQKDEFIRALTDRMMTYALGRGLERTDRRFVRDIATDVVHHDYKFSELATMIVLSDPFQKRAAAPAPAAKKDPVTAKLEDPTDRHNL